ncbi:hypothetical protein [Bacillus sp. FJAT-26390]|uniref:hypothetical protein n=1 Tax=Bacillus sp. FJAT-26390 TaxID=1743142 RepID=UPI000807DDAB|nr:hypothetical protein [Bacillus sp. FJAT-26390]OBZ13787.1 hypothetical protein A7975_13360 [Bacillus sp. FJAT-26390]
MRFRLVLMLITIIVLLSGCNEQELDVNQVMKDSKIQYEYIIHTKEIPERNLALVFYKQQEMYGLGLLEKKNSWKWLVGSTKPIEELEMSMVYNNLDQKAPMAFGVINNLSIDSVKIEIKGEKKIAEIIETPDEKRLWYVLFDEPQNPPIEVYGYDKNGEIVFSTAS